MTRCTVHCPAGPLPPRVVCSLYGPIDLDDRSWRYQLACRIVNAARLVENAAAVLHALADGDYDLARALARRAQNHERKEPRP